MINLISGKDLKDKTIYYLTSLDTYESFDHVIAELANLGFSSISQLDAIHYRTAQFNAAGKEFKIIYHDDVGVHGFSVSNEGDDKWLQRILLELVKNLNNSLGEGL